MAFSLTEDMRLAGIKADSDHAQRSLKGQFKYAGKLARFTVICGGDERQRGNVRIRDMQTREETEVPVDEVIPKIKALLDR